MLRVQKNKTGITLIETLVAIGIVVLLLGLGVSSFIDYRKAKELDTTTDAIAARLEEARTNAMSGKSGTNFGVVFASTTYTLWQGVSYNVNDSNNKPSTIPYGLTITTNLTSGSSNIMFGRINGSPSVYGSITIARTGQASSSDTINIGSYGEISVVK